MHPSMWGSCGVGMAMGRGGAEGWGLRPRLAPPRPALHDGENFLTPSPPRRAS